MKFKKGHFYIDNDEVPIGTQFIAHAVGWTKTWIKFIDQEVVERRVYRMIKGEVPVTRADLDEQDTSKWPIGNDDRPLDPWVYQYLLPMENDKDEVVIFIASSFGGKRAIADVCAAWSRKHSKGFDPGQPIIKLREVMMPSKKWGEVPRPKFEIVGWDGLRAGIREVKTEQIKNRDMDDNIPF